MSNSLEFSINAKDNTSKVVDTVNKKINNFGNDLAKMALGVAGPMALVQAGISAIGNAIDEYKQKVAEAIKFGAELPNQAKALNISVEEYQRLGSAADAAGVGINEVAQAYVEVRKAIDAAKDPTSSQAAALQALGFAAADIAAGAIKPIEVIERLGRAMATGADDATQFKIASGLLGSSVEKLIPILRKAQEATQGYTDAGDVLSEEEAAILRDFEMQKKKAELQEKVEEARKEARDKIQADPGKLIRGAGFNPKFRAAAQSLFPDIDAAEARKQFGGSVAADLAMSERGYGRVQTEDGRQIYAKEVMKLSDIEKDLIIKEYGRQEAARKDAEAAAKAAADKEAAAKLKAIADEAAAKKQKDKEAADAAKAEADKKKKADDDAAKAAAERKKEEEDKAKREKDELGKALDAEQKAKEAASKFTGSSLRDIGGALAGEAITSGIDYQAAALDISQKILIELQKLNVKTLPEVPDTNFTKPSTSRGGTYTV